MSAILKFFVYLCFRKEIKTNLQAVANTKRFATEQSWYYIDLCGLLQVKSNLSGQRHKGVTARIRRELEDVFP